MDWFKLQLENLFKTVDKRLVLILILYLALGFILLGYYQYQINPDGVGYIQTAEKYLSGDFQGAVDAYWGPLLSWLLIPFLYFNQAPTYALYVAKILSIIIGLFTIIGIRQLSYQFELDETVRTTILLIMVPVILYFSLIVITPDLLVVCLLVYYLSIIFNPKYPDRLSNGLLCGVLGAFAFFAKSYMFPFFIAQFLLLNLLHYHYRGDYPKIKITRNMLIGFLAFLLVSGVWIGLISSKEEKLTFGTSGGYNYALVGPQSNGFPQFYQGLSAPGEIDEVSTLESWSPFSSWSNFTYQLNLIWNNLRQTKSIYQYFSCISLLILLCSLLLFIPPINKFTSSTKRKPILFSLITILIYSGGYLPVLVEDRYLWPVYVLLILLGGFLVSLLFKFSFTQKSNYKTNILKGFLLVLFALSFILMPVNALYTNLNTGKDIYTLSNTLKTQYGIHGNIATNDRLIDTQYLSFYLNTTSFGQSKQNSTDEELQLQLEKYDIDYFFLWGNSTSYLIGYSEITGGKIEDLKIYKKD